MSRKSYVESNSFRSIMAIMTGVGLSVAVVGGLFVALHWLGGHVMLLNASLSVIVICFAWLIFLPKVSPLTPKLNELRGTEAGKYLYQLRACVYMLLIGGIVLSVGALFKLMHWAGAESILFAGGMTVAMLFIIMPFCYSKYLKADEREKLKK